MPDKVPGKVSFGELISKFDTMTCNREPGFAGYSSGTMLTWITGILDSFLDNARCCLSREGVSICNKVQGKYRGMMDVDHLEKKALMCHNSELTGKNM